MLSGRNVGERITALERIAKIHADIILEIRQNAVVRGDHERLL